MKSLPELSNIQIDELFEGNKAYLGCYAKDSIPHAVLNKTGFIIMNQDNGKGLNAGTGTHWTYLSFGAKVSYYCDSFGFAPPENIARIMKIKKKKCYYNTVQLQDKTTNSCGWFASKFGIEHGIKKIPFIDVLLKDFTYSPKDNEVQLMKYFYSS